MTIIALHLWPFVMTLNRQHAKPKCLCFWSKTHLLNWSLFIGFSTSFAQDRKEQSVSTERSVAFDSLFNQGNIHNAVDAINGLFPGMLVSMPGANPNELPDVLVRGIGTELGNRFINSN